MSSSYYHYICAFCRQEKPLTDFEHRFLEYRSDTCKTCDITERQLRALIGAYHSKKIKKLDFVLKRQELLNKVGLFASQCD